MRGPAVFANQWIGRFSRAWTMVLPQWLIFQFQGIPRLQPSPGIETQLYRDWSENSSASLSVKTGIGQILGACAPTLLPAFSRVSFWSGQIPFRKGWDKLMIQTSDQSGITSAE